MANERREDQATKKIEETARQSAERTAEQARRIGETASRTSAELAQVSTTLFQQNAQALQNAMRFGLETMTAVMGRSADQFNRAMGLSGDEAQQATERSARNAKSILHSTAATSQGLAGVSEEYFEFVRHQIECNIDCMNELWRCRTPHDVAAVQSDLVRHTMETALESSRRMADMSLKLADDATKQITRDIEQMQRAA
jgi:phasin family protein